ncbi:MAG: DUF6468 domain-containing protein [Acetobacterales bacterium]
MTPIVLDIVVAVLLSGVIVYAHLLNRRLGALRRHKSELLELVAGFQEATIRAETSVQTLKASAGEAGTALKTQIGQAQTLFDDLDYMVKRSNDTADRLEKAMQRGRGALGPAPVAAAGDTDPEREPAAAKPRRPAVSRPEAAQPAPRPRAEQPRPARQASSGRAPASEIERELMKALEQVR